MMPLPNFPIDKAYLVGGWLASAFWGVFTMLMCVWGVSYSRSKSRFLSGFPLAIIFMYILSTVHISIVLARLIQAFIVHVNDEGGAILYLADIGAPLNRAKDMVYVSVIVCGDSIILWRCFLVWNKDFSVIAIPFFMVLGTAVSGYGAIAQYFLPNPYVPQTVKWAESMLSISMVTNIMVTGLTAGRIWYVARDLDAKYFGASLRRYRFVIVLIVESGAIMAISKVIEFTLFKLAPDDGLNGLNALYIPMDCMPQIMGICPTFILLAVSSGLTSPGSSAHTPHSGGNGTFPRQAKSGPGSIAPMSFAPKSPENTVYMGSEVTVQLETHSGELGSV